MSKWIRIHQRCFGCATEFNWSQSSVLLDDTNAVFQNRVRTCNKHQSVPKKSGLWYSSSKLRFGFLIIWTPSYYGYDVWIYVLFDKTVFACIVSHFPDKRDW